MGQSSAQVLWFTIGAPSTSQVRWGLTPALENSTSVDSSLVQNHTVILNGLQPGTTYYFQAVSTNASGQSSSMVISKATKF